MPRGRPRTGDQANLAADTYRRLRELIVHGRLAPGSRLAEAPLAGQLGVSRTPIRSAIQRLQQEGHVLPASVESPAGPVVAPLTREDALEVFALMGKLESLAARRASALPEEERRALAARLAEINAVIRGASPVDQHSHEALHQCRWEFHRVLVERAGGPRVQALHEAMNAQAERYERIYSGFVRNQQDSADEHEALIAAIVVGDQAAAEVAAENNWIRSAGRLALVIDRAAEIGVWSGGFHA
jgi:DNA-binding GntR family transcriptional regulator